MTRPIRLYLSGQMRGLPDHGKTDIDKMKMHLEPAGFDIFTPTNARLQALNLRTIFQVDLTVILSWADAVVLVTPFAWTNSKGVMAEMTTALAAGVPVYNPKGYLDLGNLNGHPFRKVESIEMTDGGLAVNLGFGSQRLTPAAFEPIPYDHY